VATDDWISTLLIGDEESLGHKKIFFALAPTA
jgi:hypothetical protein